MVGANDFPTLIQELHSELNQDGERWERAHEIVRGKLQSPYEFLEWAKRDRHWSFTLAEVMGEVCAKPSDLAHRLLMAILEELREEQQLATPMSDL